MKKGNRFERGSGVYKCESCGRGTRSTGHGDNEHLNLCVQCFELAGMENELTDTGSTHAPGIREYFAELASKGIDGPALFPTLADFLSKLSTTGDTTMTTIAEMSKTELRTAAKAAGLKYGKMSLMQIREALTNHKPSKSKKATEPKVRKERTGTRWNWLWPSWKNFPIRPGRKLSPNSFLMQNSPKRAVRPTTRCVRRS
jgi:hypothetical protein